MNELTEEKKEEVVAPIVEEKPILGSLAGLKNLFALAVPRVSLGTKSHNPNRKRGIGTTRKAHEETKQAKKAAKSSRKVNQKRSNKVRRATGSKQRK